MIFSLNSLVQFSKLGIQNLAWLYFSGYILNKLYPSFFASEANHPIKTELYK